VSPTKTIDQKLPHRPFLMFPTSLISDRALSRHARDVYLALLVFASKEDQRCFATTETLQATVGMGKSAFYKGLNELKRRKYVYVHTEIRGIDGATRKKNTYLLMEQRLLLGELKEGKSRTND
jgi:hypothetical protein